jgi:hypothetical protein
VQRGLEQRGDDVYAMLFRHLAKARAGEANADRLKTKQWPYAVIELYLGKLSPAATLDAAVQAGGRCEGAVLHRPVARLEGEQGRGRGRAQSRCRELPEDSIEYAAAVAELKRLKP